MFDILVFDPCTQYNIEQWRTGTNEMIQETVKHGLPEPEFEDTKTSIIVTFRKSIFKEEYLEGLNERQRYILVYLKENKFIKSRDIQKKYDITRDTANRDLVALIKLNIIKKEV